VLKEQTDNRLGNAIKSARQSKGWTQSHLADLLSVTTRYLKAIENSGRKPSYALLIRIVRELDISADTFFYPESGKVTTRIFP
jgi:transcriptional regulator with XRE-family HTH domain